MDNGNVQIMAGLPDLIRARSRSRSRARSSSESDAAVSPEPPNAHKGSAAEKGDDPPNAQDVEGERRRDEDDPFDVTTLRGMITMFPFN